LEELVLKKLIASIWVLTVLVTATACSRHRPPKGPEITTPYAAVLLDNNQVYYGKLANAGSAFPELTDVLVRRGNEFHGPDKMFLNARHIIMIEPVGPNSKVAQLIAEDKAKH
jgi:hypothetical protein